MINTGCCCGRHGMVAEFTVQLVLMSAKVLSSNLLMARYIYPKKHYVLKFVSDLRQDGGFHMFSHGFRQQ